MPVAVVMAIGSIAFLVQGAVMVMVMVVVTTILGPAPVPFALFGRKVTRLRGGAEVCAQAYQAEVSDYICKYACFNK